MIIDPLLVTREGQHCVRSCETAVCTLMNLFTVPVNWLQLTANIVIILQLSAGEKPFLKNLLLRHTRNYVV